MNLHLLDSFSDGFWVLVTLPKKKLEAQTK